MAHTGGVIPNQFVRALYSIPHILTKHGARGRTGQIARKQPFSRVRHNLFDDLPTGQSQEQVEKQIWGK